MNKQEQPKCGFCGKMRFVLRPLHLEGVHAPQAAIMCEGCHAAVGIADPQSLQLDPRLAENEA